MGPERDTAATTHRHKIRVNVPETGTVDDVAHPVASGLRARAKTLARSLALLLVSALSVSCNTREDRESSTVADSSSKTVYREDEPPVSEVAADDPEMAAAIKEAKETLPEFIAAVKKGLANPKAKPDKVFNIKIALPTPDGTNEHIWVEVDGLEGKTFSGRIANEPLNLPNVKLDDAVKVEQREIEDWYISDDNGIVRGGFTAKVLMDREAAKGK